MRGGSDNRLALVLGATGGIGGETAAALLRHGWRVRAMRRGGAPEASDAIEWVAGDAMRAEDVAAAARGASLIVHAVNPPGYRDWDRLVLPMLDNSIAAARAEGARIVLPGTIYNYGPDAFPLIAEDAPQHPASRKGAVRVAMEERLEDAAEDGVRVLIVRAGDFFGPAAGNNWFSQCLVKPGRPARSVTYPGRRGVGHSWAYLPDLAETIALLANREDQLARFDRFHFGGFWDPDGTEMIAAIRRVVGDPALPARRFPWALAMLASPFVRFLRELREMRYLWEESIRLDNRKLVAFLGAEPRTPIDAAARATLVGLGCLPEAAPAHERAAARAA